MPLPLWMNAWARQMALWMTGAAIIWIALIGASAWLIACWETRTLRRVNASASQIQRAQYAHSDIDTGTYENIQLPQPSEPHA